MFRFNVRMQSDPAHSLTSNKNIHYLLPPTRSCAGTVLVTPRIISVYVSFVDGQVHR